MIFDITNTIFTIIFDADFGSIKIQEGSKISRKKFNDNLETLHLAITLFYHLPGLHL